MTPQPCRLQILFSSLLLATATVLAQDREDIKIRNKVLVTDISPSDIHAANMLNIEGNRVIRPSTMEEFKVQLANILREGVDGSGGFGLELNPVMLAYRDQASERVSEAWKGLSLSLAWSPGGNVKRAAIGVRYSYLFEGERKTQVFIDSTVVPTLIRNTSAMVHAWNSGLDVNSTTENAQNSDRAVVRMLADYCRNGGGSGTGGVVLMSGTDGSRDAVGYLSAGLEGPRRTFEERTWTQSGFSVGIGAVIRSDSSTSASDAIGPIEYSTLYANYLQEISEGTAAFCLQGRGVWSSGNYRMDKPIRRLQLLAQVLCGSNSLRGLGQLLIDAGAYSPIYTASPDLAGSVQSVFRVETGLECRIATGLWMYSTVGVRSIGGDSNPDLIVDYGIRYAPSVEPSLIRDVLATSR